MEEIYLLKKLELSCLVRQPTDCKQCFAGRTARSSTEKAAKFYCNAYRRIYWKYKVPAGWAGEFIDVVVVVKAECVERHNNFI